MRGCVVKTYVVDYGVDVLDERGVRVTQRPVSHHEAVELRVRHLQVV